MAKALLFHLPILLSLTLAGCSTITLHEKAAHKESHWHNKPWQVHCETAKSHVPSPKTKPGVHNAHWIWAEHQGELISLTGEWQDGFLAVNNVSTKTIQALPAQMDFLRAACLETIRIKHPAGYELARVEAAREGERINVPLIMEKKINHPVNRIVVFGDSLSDTGKLKKRLKIFPETPYWLGRFSNGPNWVDYIEGKFDISAQNHAHGGSAVTHHNHVNHISPLKLIETEIEFILTGSLKNQVDDYIKDQLIEKTMTHSEQTVFVIWAGANDYLAKTLINSEITTLLNTREGPAGYGTVVEEVMNEMANNIRKLYQAGARRFIVINLPDLGRTPMVLQNKTYFPLISLPSEPARQIDFSNRLSILSDYHNKMLTKTITNLRSELNGIVIKSESAFHDIDNILTNRFPTQDGDSIHLEFDLDSNKILIETKQHARKIQDKCYSGNYLGSSEPEKVCKQQHKVVFWDSVHPTTYTHCWQAFNIARIMESEGWIEKLPEEESYKTWCQKIALKEAGHYQNLWILE